MQPVHVLRDDAVYHSGALQSGNRVVAGVRRREADRPPAEMAARPVAATRHGIARERLVRHRLAAPLRAGLAAVVRYAGFSRQAGTAEYDDSPAGQELRETV